MTLLVILAAVLAWGLTGLYLRFMLAANRLEQPSERGMHTRAVPSGAGIVIALVLLVAFTGCGGEAQSAQDSDRWCCSQLFPFNGEPYITCGLPGDMIFAGSPVRV